MNCKSKNTYAKFKKELVSKIVHDGCGEYLQVEDRKTKNLLKYIFSEKKLKFLFVFDNLESLLNAG